MENSKLLLIFKRKNKFIVKAKNYGAIGFWPLLNNTLDYSGNDFHGTGTNIDFTGTGIDGKSCAYFNDAAFVNVYSAALAAAFNGNEFVIGGRCKQTTAALTDADTHDFPVFYSDVANNLIFMRSTNGSLQTVRTAQNVSKSWSPLAAGNFGANFRTLFLRVSVANDRISAYIDGTEFGGFTGNVAWEGTLSSTGSLWGASSGASKIHHWLGWMQYIGIWPILTGTQIQDLSLNY